MLLLLCLALPLRQEPVSAATPVLEAEGTDPRVADAPRGLPGAAPELSVEAGRATGFTERGALGFERGSRRVLEPSGYLELAPASRVELVWRGLASVRVHGPAALEWSPGEDGEPRLLTWFADQVELDVRRGVFAFSYAERVAIDVRRGALSVRELPGGLRVQHHGGEEARLWLRATREGEEKRWVPRRLPSGARERIRWFQPEGREPDQEECFPSM